MIFVECKPDEALVRSLVNRHARHHEGKDKLLNKLMKEEKTKAMVDQDPNASQHHYLQKMRLTQPENGIILMRDPDTQNMVIVLCPALEKWLIDSIQESRQQLTDIPSDAKRLRDKFTIHPGLVERIVRRILPHSQRLRTLQGFLQERLG